MIAVSILTFFALLIVLAAAIRAALVSAVRLPVNTDWLFEDSAERYRPMLRLLSEEDLRFLSQQRGFSPAMERRFRRDRCRIMRGYLRNLRLDYDRACYALKLVIAHSQVDRPDLVSRLVRSRISFAYCMFRIQVQSSLFAYGVGNVDVTSLLNLSQGMRLELQRLVPASNAA